MDQLPAGELIALGRCSAACLLALEMDGACRCRCGGTYHGQLASEPIELRGDPSPGHSDKPWFYRYCHYDQNHLNLRCPMVRNVEQFNTVWRAQKAAGLLFVVAEHRGRFSWAATTDTFTAKDDYQADMLEVGRKLVEVTLVAKSNRDAIGEVGPERLCVGGLRSPHDAQVLACAFSELWRGRPASALGLYEALREDVGREARSRRPASAAWLASSPTPTM